MRKIKKNTMQGKIKNKKPKVKVFHKKKKYTELELQLIEKLKAKYESIDKDSIKTFTDLPLSEKTLKGLKKYGYTAPTEIQRETIALALQGKDILGAAQTGSGKTLAFLVPLMELLFCKQWTRLDGLGALVITPTRELAYQIFETLRKIGEYHEFSAGLIIGGKDLKFERNRMDKCNIVICTPGRLLQHMDENPLFDCVNMQLLVLDEADRCLDMGFEQTMNAIITNLPPKRQTFLFSATQTKSVKDLVRLSLKNPSYISVHEHSEFSTPDGLEQSYIVCELKDKVSVLWSFIKNHLKQKCIIFFSSCKQVKYMYEIFCRLRPGTSLIALYGKLHQLKRMEIYELFCHKTSAVLFATDLAARGLDFPEVHWVVQADCPEDVATYIHRVGRTARFHSNGESLLLLLPSEKAILKNLKERKIPINEIDINPNKLKNPVRKMEAYLARDPALKDTAQRAFVSYAKSVFLMKNKQIFNVHALDTDSFATSLGLAVPPRIRFLQKLNPKKSQLQKVTNKKYFNSDSENDEDNASAADDINDNENKLEIVESAKPSLFHVSEDSDSDDGILKIKRKDHDIDLPAENELEEININKKGKKNKVITKAAIAKKILKKNIVANKKITFDDEGEAVVQKTKEKRSELAQEYEKENEGGIDIEKAKLVLKEEDKFDKQLFKEKVKAKHKEEKRKLKQKKKNESEGKDDFSSESEYEPDLSWLPDPDKIYNSENNNETNQCEDGENYEENISGPLAVEPECTKKKKRKLKNESTTKIKLKKKKLNDASLSVNETEELALMLLQNT